MEVNIQEVSFGYLWRIGVLDVTRINSTECLDKETKMWYYDTNPIVYECYANHAMDDIEIYDMGADKDGIKTSDLTNKGRQTAIDIFKKYGLKYNEKYLGRIGDV